MQQSGAPVHRPQGNQSAVDRGKRFKDAVYAKAAEKSIHTDVALAREAGVSENTLRNWWQGKGLELGTLVAVAGTIDTTVFDLLDAWQGGPTPRPPTLAEAISALATELAEARRERDDVQARLLVLESRLPSPGGPADAGPRARSVRGASTGSAG